MKTSSKLASSNTNVSKKIALIDFILISLVTASLIGFSYLLILFQIEGEVVFSRSLFPDQFLVASAIALIATVVALVKNRRTVLTMSAYLCLGALFFWLRSINSNAVLLEVYILARNIAYVYLLIYFALHFTLIGISRFKKPEHKLVTPLGVINWWVICMLVNYLHALVWIGR
jgi:lysylphosphatidylglycerol synthetase-like protein (DUF2156 family)